MYVAAHGVYKRRNKDKYKQEGAWKQIPLRMRNESRGDWKYPVCSGGMGAHGNVQISRFTRPTKNRERPASIRVLIRGYFVISTCNNVRHGVKFFSTETSSAVRAPHEIPVVLIILSKMCIDRVLKLIRNRGRVNRTFLRILFYAKPA